MKELEVERREEEEVVVEKGREEKGIAEGRTEGAGGRKQIFPPAPNLTI